MNYVDILAICYSSKKYSPRMLIACIMYLIIGGKDIMHAFQMDYSEMFQAFEEQFPILDNNSISQVRLPEGILFYNQIIQPFFVNEFGYYLQDLIEPLKYVLKYFVLNIGDNFFANSTLIEQCRYVLGQNREISAEKIVTQLHDIDHVRQEF